MFRGSVHFVGTGGMDTQPGGSMGQVLGINERGSLEIRATSGIRAAIVATSVENLLKVLDAARVDAVSSEIDFPEEYTSDPHVISLCRGLRQGSREAADEAHLSDGAMGLFLRLANDAGNWSGTPLVDGLTPEEKGYLTDLKKKGLLDTEEHERGCVFAFFSDLGYRIARASGVEIYRDFLPLERATR